MTRLICGLLVGLAPALSSAADFAVRRFSTDPAQARSGAVRVDHADLVYSGQLMPPGEGDLDKQLPELLKRTTNLLKLNGLTPADLVKLNLYIADSSDAAPVTAALSKWLDPDKPAAVSWVTTSLPTPGCRIGLDFVAAYDHPRAPAASVQGGPAGVMIIPATATTRAFVSGQAEKGDGSVADATAQTMASLFRTLTFLELSPKNVVQVKVFIRPMNESRASLAAIQKAFDPETCPPVVFVEWDSPSLPVEIELVAAASQPIDAERPVAEYLTPPGMKPSPVYAKVVRVQSPSTIFLSGLYGSQVDPDSEAELRDLFAQTKQLAEEAGSDLKHLVKATYYVSSKGSSDQHNKLRPEYYDPARPPAASKAIVKGVGRSGRTITWDMIAVPK
ncbi:MAG TPA: RidA family protein [Caulifigura sp.]|jgi:enamine deaminase RidA (YjgF/YER057c/UK114 family)|nr:RidA family protein [Caulifigura sp.]